MPLVSAGVAVPDGTDQSWLVWLLSPDAAVTVADGSVVPLLPEPLLLVVSVPVLAELVSVGEETKLMPLDEPDVS